MAGKKYYIVHRAWRSATYAKPSEAWAEVEKKYGDDFHREGVFSLIEAARYRVRATDGTWTSSEVCDPIQAWNEAVEKYGTPAFDPTSGNAMDVLDHETPVSWRRGDGESKELPEALVLEQVS